MITFDDKSEPIRKYVFNKWKEMLPAISLEASITCEKMQVDYINGVITEEEFKEKINTFLTKQNLIK